MKGNYWCAITSCGSFAERLNDADSAFDCNRPRVPKRDATPAYLRASLEISARRDAIHLEVVQTSREKWGEGEIEME